MMSLTAKQLRDEITRRRPQYAGKVWIVRSNRNNPDDGERTVVVRGLGSFYWANLNGSLVGEVASIIDLMDDLVEQTTFEAAFKSGNEAHAPRSAMRWGLRFVEQIGEDHWRLTRFGQYLLGRLPMWGTDTSDSLYGKWPGNPYERLAE